MDNSSDTPSVSNVDFADSRRFKGLAVASLIALSADLFLIILKYSLAKLTGNVVLTADAWHSTGDFALTLTVFTSIMVNYRFKDKAWARNAEGLVALLISFILIIGSLSIFWETANYTASRFVLSPDISLVVAILGINIACGIAFYMSRYKHRIAQKFNSIAFLAESAHTYSDFFTSLGVLLTLILGYFGIHLERLMTFLVGVVVFRIGVLIHLRALRFFNISLSMDLEKSKALPWEIRGVLCWLKRAFSYLYRNYKSAEHKIGSTSEGMIRRRPYEIMSLQLLIVFLLYLGTGFYTIPPYRTGVEVAFGEVSELTSPGLHYHLPKPFGDVIRVDTGVVARIESGYRTLQNYEGEEPDAYLWEFAHQRGRYLKVPEEAITLTGDENLVDFNVLCYYRIEEPVAYAFNSENSHELLRNLFTFEAHKILAEYHLDTLMTTGRKQLQERLKKRMEVVTEQTPVGVKILNVYLEEVHPPLEVVPDYRAVASSRERRNEVVHKANAYANDLIPKSRGRAKALKANSRAYVEEKIRLAEGIAQKFSLKQRQFRRYEASQEDRLWIETMEKALNNKKVFVLPKDSRRRMFTTENKEGLIE
ncbi:MAG: hypothetical protein GF315_14750 [candidate division Zixibacteria bacterium]|nr:hypothetical protein [candidate division Zixibacteria bacterium]